MQIHTPQIIYFICTGLLLIEPFFAPKATAGTPNAVASIQHLCAWVGILLWGGFFHQMGAPQVIFICLASLILLCNIKKHGSVVGKPGADPRQVAAARVVLGVTLAPVLAVLMFLLYYWGGFFG